jgi:predicted nucleotidyltransferase
VDQSLSRLARKQLIRRVDRGIYSYPKTSRLVGELSPDPKKVADALARRDAATLLPSGAMAANLLGLSDQVPSQVVYLTSGPKREAKVKKLTITLKPTVAKNLATAKRATGVVIQALRYLGKDQVGSDVVEKLRKRLNPEQRQQLLKDIRYAPAWMGPVFRKVAAETSDEALNSSLPPERKSERFESMFDAEVRAQVEEACREFSVRALYVFGSFARGDAKEESDVDLLVEFERDGVEGAFDQFMGFKERMEVICGRPVDLVTSKRFRNPYFEQSVAAEKQLVYAA